VCPVPTWSGCRCSCVPTRQWTPTTTPASRAPRTTCTPLHTFKPPRTHILQNHPPLHFILIDHPSPFSSPLVSLSQALAAPRADAVLRVPPRAGHLHPPVSPECALGGPLRRPDRASAASHGGGAGGAVVRRRRLPRVPHTPRTGMRSIDQHTHAFFGSGHRVSTVGQADCGGPLKVATPSAALREATPPCRLIKTSSLVPCAMLTHPWSGCPLCLVSPGGDVVMPRVWPPVVPLLHRQPSLLQTVPRDINGPNAGRRGKERSAIPRVVLQGRYMHREGNSSPLAAMYYAGAMPACFISRHRTMNAVKGALTDVPIPLVMRLQGTCACLRCAYASNRQAFLGSQSHSPTDASSIQGGIQVARCSKCSLTSESHSPLSPHSHCHNSTHLPPSKVFLLLPVSIQPRARPWSAVRAAPASGPTVTVWPTRWARPTGTPRTPPDSPPP
jgi:hypothetical protein